MEAPKMASITALEQSFQNCSLNRSNSHGGVTETSNGAEEDLNSNTTTTLELNSHLTLPYQWEQCLDLKTGEIYYINWETGTKKKEDPRKKKARECYSYTYSEEEDEEEEDDDTYYSDGDSSSSSAASSPSPFREDYNNNNNNNNNQEGGGRGDHILVVAGCKSCMMYFMLPKRVEECPKCNGFLLHFDRLESGSF